MATLYEPNTVDLGFAPKLREHVATVTVEHEALLYEQGTGAMHQLNPTAAAICSLFDGEVTLATLVEDLVAVFQGDPDVIAADVLEVTRELGRKGLLVNVRGDHEADASSS